MVKELNQNTDISTFIPDGQFKDCTPLDTVARIKGILANLGIETFEKWNPTSVPYCHAMSIKIPGTLFSVNGKGLTKEFTLASAYGELMERLQLGYVNGANGKRDGDNAMEAALWKKVSAAELQRTNPIWYERLSQCAQKIAHIQISSEQIVSQYADQDGLVPVMTFYDLTNDVAVYFPVKLCKHVYTTNGSAAGNSPEETIVQAISEIVERHHQMRVITENLTLPDIPEDELKKHAAAYSIIQYVRDHGYRVIIKDCSLGTAFPVVCACFIDERTGKYHTHFGAYPVFEIALERSLTETFQGRTIEDIGKFEDFIAFKSDEYSFASIFNEMTIGTWKKTAEFFAEAPSIPYNPNAGLQGSNNRELLRECVSYFKRLDYDILVRDSSSLGFCTYQVVIPGYSEMFLHRLAPNHNEQRYCDYASKTLRNPAKATIQDILGLLMHMEQQKVLTANLSGVHGFSAIAKLPAKLDQQQSDLLMSASLAYVNYALGKYGEVIKCLDAMILRSSDTGFLICLKRYLNMRLCGNKPEQIREKLAYFHGAETVDDLFGCLSQNQNPLDRYVLHCDMHCNESCPIRQVCYHKRSLSLVELLTHKMSELDFEIFSNKLKAIL